MIVILLKMTGVKFPGITVRTLASVGILSSYEIEAIMAGGLGLTSITLWFFCFTGGTDHAGDACWLQGSQQPPFWEHHNLRRSPSSSVCLRDTRGLWIAWKLDDNCSRFQHRVWCIQGGTFYSYSSSFTCVYAVLVTFNELLLYLRSGSHVMLMNVARVQKYKNGTQCCVFYTYVLLPSIIIILRRQYLTQLLFMAYFRFLKIFDYFSGWVKCCADAGEMRGGWLTVLAAPFQG